MFTKIPRGEHFWWEEGCCNVKDGNLRIHDNHHHDLQIPVPKTDFSVLGTQEIFLLFIYTQEIL